ncbi:SPRY domain-containing SOCS box protein 3-like isoform X2 [Panonychus citri]|uniref:SPRY domain-containing SOCS box protein 3-like isoform X2 n=1 Tax=Panonychus citri TaxID=50023 RepID=UPI0023077A7F|nr:SPRY domain-containing SOCS box protein 3-like isoform X2 [Panonychus citri]
MDSMFCRPDHWTWSSKAKSREVKIFGKERRRIIFHPHWSNGTAGVRGNRILNSGHQECIYWEVRLPDRVFGTSMMFGIGTSKTRLQANMFTNLLGEDDQSWGLSHKGYIWHNGESRKFCKPFRENVKTTIGLLYDSCQGTLTYYKDGVKLGVAFRGLNQVSSSLYPLVSSTAAKTVMILCNLKVAYYCSTLKERFPLCQMTIPMTEREKENQTYDMKRVGGSGKKNKKSIPLISRKKEQKEDDQDPDDEKDVDMLS